MKTKKVSFFKRVKDAVINFDSYLGFSEEKLSSILKDVINEFSERQSLTAIKAE